MGSDIMKLRDRVTCPYTGKRGKVVFISPINKRIYVEFVKGEPFVTYLPEQLTKRGGDLFAAL